MNTINYDRKINTIKPTQTKTRAYKSAIKSPAVSKPVSDNKPYEYMGVGRNSQKPAVTPLPTISNKPKPSKANAMDKRTTAPQKTRVEAEAIQKANIQREKIARAKHSPNEPMHYIPEAKPTFGKRYLKKNV